MTKSISDEIVNKNVTIALRADLPTHLPVAISDKITTIMIYAISLH